MESAGRCFVCRCSGSSRAAAGFGRWGAGGARAMGGHPAEAGEGVAGGLACLAARGGNPEICCFWGGLEPGSGVSGWSLGSRSRAMVVHGVAASPGGRKASPNLVTPRSIPEGGASTAAGATRRASAQRRPGGWLCGSSRPWSCSRPQILRPASQGRLGSAQGAFGVGSSLRGLCQFVFAMKGGGFGRVRFPQKILKI